MSDRHIDNIIMDNIHDEYAYGQYFDIQIVIMHKKICTNIVKNIMLVKNIVTGLD